MPVAGIGVAARAIGTVVAHRVVDVPAQHRDAGGAQQLRGAVGVGPEAAQVAEAERGVGAAPRQVREGRGERVMVAVDAAEEREMHQPLAQVIPVTQQVWQAPCASSNGPSASASRSPMRPPGSSTSSGHT